MKNIYPLAAIVNCISYKLKKRGQYFLKMLGFYCCIYESQILTKSTDPPKNDLKLSFTISEIDDIWAIFRFVGKILIFSEIIDF